MNYALITICFVFCAVSAETKEIVRSVPVTKAKTIAMRGFHGSTIDIKAWEKNEISVRLTVHYSSSDKERAKEAIQAYDVMLQETNDSLSLTFKEPVKSGGFSAIKEFFNSLFSSSYTDITVTGVIHMPAAMNLVSDMRYGVYSVTGMTGNVRLFGIANVLTVANSSSVKVIENSFGKTKLENSGGAVVLTSESANITVRKFSGSFKGNLDYSYVLIEGVSSSAEIACRNGNVDVSDVGGDAAFETDFSTVSAANVRGKVTVRSQSGTIRLKNSAGVHVNAPFSTIELESVDSEAETVLVRNNNGQTTLTGIRGNVTISDSYSQIQLSQIRGNVSVEGEGNTLRGRMIDGNVSVKNQYGDVRFEELSAQTVEIQNIVNPVTVQLVSKPSRIDISNPYGPVTVSMPDFSGHVRLEASYGTIDTNVPLETGTTPVGETASGKIGTGNGIISISTISGRIDLRWKK